MDIFTKNLFLLQERHVARHCFEKRNKTDNCNSILERCVKVWGAIVKLMALQLVPWPSRIVGSSIASHLCRRNVLLDWTIASRPFNEGEVKRRRWSRRELVAARIPSTSTRKVDEIIGRNETTERLATTSTSDACSTSEAVIPAMEERRGSRYHRAVHPEHLLVLVHGINAGPSDWDDVKDVFQSQLGSRFVIHASAANPTFQTFVGIDLAGKRLADEVRQIVRTMPGLKRISFVAHSLGGLFQRYAIADLYKSGDSTIAGLDPVTFITMATPHLGMRGSKSLPMAFGVPILEDLAAFFTIGRTTSQLFVTDGDLSDPPLLLRMASDCSDGLFISALKAFKSRATYANVNYDQMVGWRTASIRRESELTEPSNQFLEGYKHIVSETYCPATESIGPMFQPETARKKAVAQIAPWSLTFQAYHETLEEEMIRGLQQVSWTKVDMSFHSATMPFLAHNHFHVKYVWPIQFEGEGLIAHVADSLQRHEHESAAGWSYRSTRVL